MVQKPISISILGTFVITAIHMFKPSNWRGENNVRVYEMLEFLIKIGLEDLLGVPKPPKSKDFAYSFRHRGNEEFLAKNLVGAIELYSKAAAYAPSGSKELGLAFGNRSAALFYMERHEAAYEDAGRALELIDDDRIKDKLQKRRAMCLRVEQRPQSPQEGFGINHRNPRIPCASAAIDVKFDAKTGGLGVFAEEDISPGQVLAIQKPYVKILHYHFYYKFCCKCCRPCDTLIPCEGCQYAMFCSEACRIEALRLFHRYECPIMDYLVKMGFHSLDLLALRTVIKAKLEFSSWTEIDKVLQKIKAEPENSVTKGFVTIRNEAGIDEAKYDTDCYESLYARPLDYLSHNINETAYKSVVVAVLLFLLHKHSSFFECEVPDKDEQAFYGGLMLHHSMRMKDIGFSSLKIVADDRGNFIAFTSAIYPFLNLFACFHTSNIEYEEFGNLNVLFALSSIPKGGQLFKQEFP